MASASSRLTKARARCSCRTGIHPVERLADALVAGGARGERLSGSCCPLARSPRATIATLLPQLARGDLLVDGGNANYKDVIAAGGEQMLSVSSTPDVGVSGGVWGLANGCA